MQVTVLFNNKPEQITLPDDATVAHLTTAICKRTGKLASQVAFTREPFGNELETSEKVEPGSKLLAKTKDLPGLDHLGPFEIEPDLGITYKLDEDESIKYIEMIGPRECINKLHKVTGGRERSFQISPKHKVTLPESARINAHIPLGDDVHFCFVYPFVRTKYTTDEKIKQLNPNDKYSALMLFGGYLYLNGKNEVLKVNGIKQGPGLYFEGPFVMTKKCFDYIYKEGRFQEITIALKQCKAFCWLFPDEQISIKEKIGGVPPFVDGKGNEVTIKDGAFGYQCVGGAHRIFRIMEKIPESAIVPRGVRFRRIISERNANV